MTHTRTLLLAASLFTCWLAACGGSDAAPNDGAGNAGSSGHAVLTAGSAGFTSAGSANSHAGAGGSQASGAGGAGLAAGAPNSAGAAGAAQAGAGGSATSNAGSSGASSAGANNAGSAGSAHGGSTGSAGNTGIAGNSGSAGNTGSSLPAKIVAGYYPNWTESPVRIKDVSPQYNLIYLFAATPVGGAPGTTGAVTWTAPGNGRGAATNLNADIQYARTTQGRKILLSIGGANNGMSFPNRSKSQAFVDSVVGWSQTLGGIDGIDWNTFEGNQAPDTSEMIWISLALKQHFPGFIISAPPAPWNSVDKAFCSAMVKAGALDYAAPQYYDGPNLATQAYMESNVADWVTLLGASKVVVGFGIWDQPNYMSIADAVKTWKSLAASTPTLRGAFDWQIHTDEAQGWPFATQLGPLVH